MPATEKPKRRVAVLHVMQCVNPGWLPGYPDKDKYLYRVTKVTNTVDFRIGEELRHDRVKELLAGEDGLTVHIS